jgi:predicted GNAT family acetyltransferase
MNVVEYPNARAFLAENRERLMENEIGNAIILSYAVSQTRGVGSSMSTRFYSVMDDGTPVLPAMFTPEIVPLLSDGTDEAARLFARFLFAKNPRAEGVNGPKESTLAFADEWEHLTRCNLEIHMNSRIYTCSQVAEIERAKGETKLADDDDLELVLEWRHGFREDAGVMGDINEAQTLERINAGKYFLWVTDQPVSMAMRGAETLNGEMIGAVYTPPEHRNQGYATAVTAAVTQAILDGGKNYASLYTDLDNPTSNSIYQQIGYKPVMDTTSWKFTPAI